MKFSFDLQLGNRSIRIEEEVAGEHQFFQRMAFWDSLPASGPSGEDDLRFSYRTPKGFEYYAIECRSAGMQFDFGQMNKQSKDLFPKSWSRIQHGQRDEHDEWAGDSAPATGSTPPPPLPPPVAPRTTGQVSTRLDQLFAVITELCQFRQRADVEAQITKWAKNRPLEDLNDAEIGKVVEFAAGWLNATKKQQSRAA